MSDLFQSMIKLGVQDALSQRPTRFIDSETVISVQTTDALALLIAKELDMVRGDTVEAILRLTTDMPVLFYVDKLSETKYNANKLKESFLVCNNVRWVSSLVELGVKSDKYEEVLSKTLSKVQTHAKKLDNEIAEGVTSGVILKYAKGSLSASVKRAGVDLVDFNFKAYPLPYLWGYALGLYNLGKNGLLEIVYMKLDGQERTHYYTNNPTLIAELYGDDVAKATEVADLTKSTFNAERLLLNAPFSLSLLNGMLSLVDFTLGKNNHSLTRNISVTTVKSLRVLLGKELDDKKVELAELIASDIENVVANFTRLFNDLGAAEQKECAEALRNEFEMPSDVGVVETVELYANLKTTAFKVSLHRFMRFYADKWFNGYTGLIGVDDYLSNQFANHSVVSLNDIDDLDLPF